MYIRTQVATMLLENIQRNDLTVYEQAQGFQMMLNLGDSVGDISTRTGFSDSTIRRRVKLLELDQEKFATSVERGATFADYEELNKVKNIKTRNTVLEQIGTSNFDWALRNALGNERRAENKVALLAILDGFATKINSKETKDHQYIRYISLDNTNLDIPEDADSKAYYYTSSSTDLTLYKEREEQPEKPQKTAEDIEHEKNVEQLTALFDRAYELRVAFVQSFRATNKQASIIEKKVIDILFGANASLDKDIFRALFGIGQKFRWSWENPEKGESYEEALARIMADHAKTNNATMLFLGIYCYIERADLSCKQWGGSLRYEKNEKLAALYDFLVALGYPMSDGEKTLLDGTHELYDTSPDDEDDDEDEDEDEYDECDDDEEDSDEEPGESEDDASADDPAAE
jgi:ParB family chromosome partitioning protein